MDDKQESSVDLPEWLEALLPQYAPTLNVSYNKQESRLEVVKPNGEILFIDSLSELDRVRVKEGLDLKIDKSVYDKFSDNNLFLYYDIEGSKNVGMVIEYTDEKRHIRLKECYKSSLKALDRYKQEPSFLNAWNMIDKHPAFWTALNLKKNPWGWETYGHCSRLRTEVSSSETGEVIVYLETGSHVPEEGNQTPPYSTHYADWRLEVSGRTYEEAIIALAERVSLCFNPDGTDRSEEEIGLEPPEWVNEVLRRISDD